MTVRQRRRLAAVLASVPLAFAATGIAMADTQSDTPTATIALNPYAPNGVGQGNNQGNGKAPANGTVGNADDKNPPGQAPNGSDHNNGYECDKNKGVGNNGGNPAHSSCSTPSATPTASISPKPTHSPKPTTSPSASQDTSPTASPSKTPPTKRPTTPPPSIVSGSPEAPVVCQIGPGCNPPPPPPSCEQPLPGDNEQNRCLPYTGSNVDKLALQGGMALMIGLLMLAILNLENQVRKYIKTN